MSVRTASGVSWSTALRSSVERRGGPDDLDLAGLLEERDRPLTDQVVILREDHAQHARIVHGGSVAA